MDKLNLDEMDVETRFLIIASMKVALTLEKKGINKEQFMDYCLGIWESIKFSDPKELENILNSAMDDDIERFANKYKKNEGYNGHCC